MTENSSTSPKLDATRGSETPLESWKEIGAYLQKDITTVRRWERKEGLPVHRHTHESRSSVYAYASEIERWRASRKVAAEPVQPLPLWRRLLTPSFALTMLLSLVMVGNGVRPEVVSAQQAGLTRTLICSGPECDQGQISPDGKSLLVRLDGSLVIRDLATKKLRTVVPALDAGMKVLGGIFSPDGSRIAYTRRRAPGTPQDREASEEAAVVNVNGSGSRMVYRGGGAWAWSADGRRLLLDYAGTAARGFPWLDIASGSMQKLPGEHWNVAATKVSPDGRYIAFNASKDEASIENAHIMASDGSGETLVSPSPAYQEPHGWTPDGKNLIYGQYDSSVTLWTVPVANGKIQGPPTNMRMEMENHGFLGFSRSGALYYWAREATSDIYTAELDSSTGQVTSAPAPLTLARAGHGAGPQWAPDSRQLLYFVLGGDPRELHVYSSDTASDRGVLLKTRNYQGYCWSRDGASIFFNSAEDPRHREAARLNLADGRISPQFPGGTPFVLSTCSGDMAAGFTPSGIEARNLINGPSKQLYAVGPNAGSVAAIISHDGRSVAFMTPRIVGTATQAPGVLHVVSSDGGPVRDLATAPAPAEFQLVDGLAWSGDDRFIYFARRPNSRSPFELFRVPAAGGAAESAGLKVQDIRTLSIPPDGTKIAFSMGAMSPEIWRVEGFLPGKK